MAANQEQIPGDAYYNEGTATVQVQIPGGAFINAVGTATSTYPAWIHGATTFPT